MARVLGVSEAGFHAWRRRPASAHAVADAALLKRIRTIHGGSRETYGVPRVHAELRAGGEKHGRKRIARLMRAAGWLAPAAGAGRRYNTAGQGRAAGARLGGPQFRCFAAEPALGCRHHLRADGERFSLSRSRAGCLEPQDRWLVDGQLSADRIGDGRIGDGGRPAAARGVIHHSDQGSQYTSLAFGKRCQEAGVRPSMGSVGDAYDNAMCESFFATLECELLDRRRFASQARGQDGLL